MKTEEIKKQEELNEEQLDNVSGGCAGKDMPEQITSIQGARIPWWAAKGQVPGIRNIKNETAKYFWRFLLFFTRLRTMWLLELSVSPMQSMR